MKIRKVAIVAFIDDKSVIVQERGGHSKVGEKYGFWGGQIEEGETKEEAVRREMLEELGFIPKILTYLGKYPFIVKETGKFKGLRVEQFVFISPITQRLIKSKIKEGDGMVLIDLDKAIAGDGFIQGSTYFLNEVN